MTEAAGVVLATSWPPFCLWSPPVLLAARGAHGAVPPLRWGRSPGGAGAGRCAARRAAAHRVARGALAGPSSSGIARPAARRFLVALSPPGQRTHAAMVETSSRERGTQP